MADTQKIRTTRLKTCLRSINAEYPDLAKFVRSNMLTGDVFLRRFLVLPFDMTPYDEDLRQINPDNVKMLVDTQEEAHVILSNHYRIRDEHPRGCFVCDLDKGKILDYYEEITIRWGTPGQPQGAPPPIV